MEIDDSLTSWEREIDWKRTLYVRGRAMGEKRKAQRCGKVFPMKGKIAVGFKSLKVRATKGKGGRTGD